MMLEPALVELRIVKDENRGVRPGESE